MLLGLKFILVMMMILMAVAFFTLLERKALGYMHNRFGPNKVGILGLFQPFGDALKLFSKEIFKLKSLNLYFFYFAPLLGIFLSVFLWGFLIFWGGIAIMKFCMILLFCFMSMSIYFLLYSGWSSSSKYSITGSFRSSAQALSYEIPMLFLILMYFFLSVSYSNVNFIYSKLFYLYMFMFIFPSWILCCLAETNRSPMDFSESESELVSGFNTEYMGGLFSVIFIAEYSSILFLSMITTMMMIGFFTNYFFWFFLISYIFLWVRSSFPRLRYDKLMLMAWKNFIVVMTLIVYVFLFWLEV